jgi:hypothetical protein
MDPVRITGVINWPMPSTKIKVQSFIGFVNFYPLDSPTIHVHYMKDVRFNWGLLQKDFFTKLKEPVTLV